ncbi:hypothetical protein [Longirhabdus pacifica]|uniref:hypothetical protein n=1 Tax=Longirhabdus pacifica TaxID=2305227 RepID=UPI0010092D0C|nr:hypothetical protein [Longirhabdus pacifica]
MTNSRVMKWVTGGLEAVLAIPFIGALIIIGFSWTPLVVMLVLHIVTLALSSQNREGITGSVLGIITSCIGWIPFVGWIMHVLTATFLMISASTPSTKPMNRSTF